MELIAAHATLTWNIMFKEIGMLQHPPASLGWRKVSARGAMVVPYPKFQTPIQTDCGITIEISHWPNRDDIFLTGIHGELPMQTLTER